MLCPFGKSDAKIVNFSGLSKFFFASTANLVGYEFPYGDADVGDCCVDSCKLADKCDCRLFWTGFVGCVVVDRCVFGVGGSKSFGHRHVLIFSDEY